MNTPSRSARWVKSSYSGSTNDCVEVAALTGETHGVRDSKRTASPILTFDTTTWNTFLDSAANGEFDHV
jgi:hypothetical protein